MGNFFCCVRVDEGTVGIKGIEFGRYDKHISPGFHCMAWPLGSELLARINTRHQKCVFTFEATTMDLVCITLEVSLIVKVTGVEGDYKKAFYAGNPLPFFEIHVVEVARGLVFKNDLQDMRTAFSDDLIRLLTTQFAVFGYVIEKASITNVQLDPEMKRKFLEKAIAKIQ